MDPLGARCEEGCCTSSSKMISIRRHAGHQERLGSRERARPFKARYQNRARLTTEVRDNRFCVDLELPCDS